MTSRTAAARTRRVVDAATGQSEAPRAAWPFATIAAWIERTRKRKKEALRNLVSADASRLLYLDHIDGRGEALFEQASALDLEGIVAKPALSPYGLVGGKAPWLKVKNPEYSREEGRAELFNKRS